MTEPRRNQPTGFNASEVDALIRAVKVVFADATVMAWMEPGGWRILSDIQERLHNDAIRLHNDAVRLSNEQGL